MWPARPGCCSVENDKSPDTDHFVGGHHQASSPAKISQKIHKGDKSLKIWSSQSVHKIIYHLIFWETDGGREMPGLSNANCCQSWVIAPSVGQPRSLGVTWAMADTVIIINAATQCRTFSHLQLRSKSSGQWDKKSQFWPQQNKWHMGQISDVEATFTELLRTAPNVSLLALHITCSVTPQINYYWILMFPHGVN